MVNASNEFKRLLEEGNRNYMEYADITLRDGTVLNLTNKELWNGGITIDDAVSSDNSFDVGAAIINKATLTINNIYEEFSEYDFGGAEFVPYIGLILDEVDENARYNLLRGTNSFSEIPDIEGMWEDGTWGQASEKVRTKAIPFALLDPPIQQLRRGAILTYDARVDHNKSGAFLRQNNVPMQQGKNYVLTCYARCTRATTTLNMTVGSWDGFYNEEFPLNTKNNKDWKRFSTQISDFDLSPDSTYVEFSVSGTTGMIEICGMKLEEGTESTSYTLALEDQVRTEKLRKGTFAVDDPKYNGSIITLECLDNMRKFDRLYSESKLEYPATLGQIVWDACSECGVTLETLTFPHDDFVVAERPKNEAITFREIISWAAQIAGCFCRCNVYGRLELKWYPQKEIDRGGLDGGFFDTSNPNTYESGDSADGGSFDPWNTGYKYDAGTFEDINNIHYLTSIYTYDVATDDVVITGVEILEKTKANEEEGIVSYKTGEPGYLITIDGNELIQKGKGKEISKWLGNQLIGLRFRKATLNHASDPTIEAGDVGYFMNRKQQVFPFLVSSTKFSTGSSQTTSSSAKTPERNSAAGYSNSTRNYLENREYTTQTITEYDKSVQMLTNLITQSFGVFKTEDVQSDGSVIYYLHNKPTIAESKTIWKITADAFAVSTDGGKTWNAGMDSSGNAVVNVLSAIRIQAEWINAENLNAISANIGDWHIDDKAICKDVRIGDIIYRVYFQPPLDSVPEKTWVLSCQKSEDGGKSFSGNFILYSNGDAKFGSTWIYASGQIRNNSQTSKNDPISMSLGNSRLAGFLRDSMACYFWIAEDDSYNRLGASISGKDYISFKNLTEDEKYSIEIARFYTKDYAQSRGVDQIRFNGTVSLPGMRFSNNASSDGGTEIQKATMSIEGTQYDAIRIDGGLRVSGPFLVEGGSNYKMKVVTTQDYNKRSLYCYEMPSPMFGDIGQGITDENGQCVIAIDDVFSETISPQIEYQVFLQKEGPGDIWVEQKEQDYFSVNGTPNLKFAWEVKAIQKECELERLEEFSEVYENPEIDYEEQYINEIEKLISQNEEVLYDETAQ